MTPPPLVEKVSEKMSLDLNKLPEKDRARILSLLDQKQSDQFMNLYSDVVNTCFKDCINGFTSSSLSESENKCLKRCAEKLLNHANRIGTRMAEKQMTGLPSTTTTGSTQQQN